ncbi:MAG: hypothetical protein GEU75_05395 [Dehalococcoidia bacterium]|nr:hypothetical protein [Dehalococcoidia bacterium]
MMTTKQDIIEMIEQMPEDASPEDIMYEIYVRERIDRGIQEAREGKVIPHEEVKQSLNQWLRSAGQ